MPTDPDYLSSTTSELKWWAAQLDLLQRKLDYMAEQNIPIPDADRVLLDTVQVFVTKYLVQKLTEGNSDETDA
jgi:hypothetical protein